MKALVVASGSCVPLELLLGELVAADIIISADGGAGHLAAVGRHPDILVGDMDSIDAGLLQEMESTGVEIIRVAAEKDETDAWLAVDVAIARGADEIVMLGALGGRIDHTLGNLMLLVRAANKGVKAIIKDGGSEIFAATGAIEIAGKAGLTVSLLPAGSGVSVRYLDGMRYGTREPLPLPVDSPVGVSNLMTADVAHVEIVGWAFVVINIEGSKDES